MPSIGRGICRWAFALAVAEALACNEVSDATQCLQHTAALGVHSCAWCATQRVCHDVGSPYNTCDAACCASRAALSTCAHRRLADLLDQTLCTGFVDATVWWNDGDAGGGSGAEDDGASLSLAWPDDADARAIARPSNGVALSGGGSRAFSSALGAYRALFDLGLLATTRHVVAVSGGTWFARCATV
jgi:hypothetical protein